MLSGALLGRGKMHFVAEGKRDRNHEERKNIFLGENMDMKSSFLQLIQQSFTKNHDLNILRCFEIAIFEKWALVWKD